jgi:hypothetical protein
MNQDWEDKRAQGGDTKHAEAPVDGSNATYLERYVTASRKVGVRRDRRQVTKEAGDGE